MKKFLSFIVFLMVIITSSNLSSAYESNKYDNSQYYVFVTTSQGQIYLDLRTVNVHDYNPPYYQIAGEFIWVNGDKESRFDVVIRYNFDTKEIYDRGDGYWTNLDVNGDSNVQKSNRKFADALFRAAYGMDFYGSSFENSIDESYHNEDIQKYTEQIKKNPNNASVYYNRGTVYFVLEKYHLAIKDFDKAIQLNPNYLKAYYDRGSSYGNLGQYEKTVQDLSKVIQLDTNFAFAYYNRGVAYSNLGQYEQAIKDFNKAIEIIPIYYNAYYDRGNVYCQLKQYDKAIQDFNKTIKLNPNYTDAYNNRGIAYALIGNLKQAIADATKVIQLNPKDFKAYVFRGICYQKLNDETKAKSDFAKAKELGYKG